MKVYIKNKLLSLSGKSDVVDVNGNPVYNVKGRVISPTRVKRVCDLAGNRLYKVRNRFFNIIVHSSFIYDENGKKIAKVKSKLFSPDFDIKMYDDSSMHVDGKWFSLSATIVKNDVPVAIVRRQFDQVRDLFRDAFELETGEKDMPFMIALVIAIDNICDNRSK